MISYKDLKNYVKSDFFLQADRVHLKSNKAPSISFVIICKDEERCISRCLDSIVDIASEVIVIDTGSLDGTLEIVSKYEGVNVFKYGWNDNFADARNFGITKVKSDWIFFIDADEWLLDDEYLIELIDYVGSYRLSNESTFSPKIKSDDASVTWSNGRLFKKSANIKYRGRVHEEPCLANGSIPYNVPIDISVRHDGYVSSIVRQKEKYKRNLILLEKSLIDEPDDLRWRFFLLRDKFIQCSISEVNLIKDGMMNLMDEIYNYDEDSFSIGYFRELYKYIMMILYSQREFRDMKDLSSKYKDVLCETSDYFYYVTISEIEMFSDSYRSYISNKLDMAIAVRENVDTADNYSLSTDGYHIDEVIYLCLKQLDCNDLCEKYRVNILNNYSNRMIVS